MGRPAAAPQLVSKQAAAATSNLPTGDDVAAKVKSQRAVAAVGFGVGLTRYQLYRNAWKRITTATRDGYHLEAITLLESILTDRMESRASYLAGTNVGFQNLGPLIQRLNELETLPEFQAILGEIDAWRVLRNQAVHEMVKFRQGEHPTWEQKLSPLSRIVREGMRVVRAFDAVDKQER